QPEPNPHQGARGAGARVEDPVAGAIGGRQEPTGLLPARADESDPERAWRGDDQTKEIEELSLKIEAVGMPEGVKKEALRELDRLSQMPVAAAEYTVSRTYLDWLVALPWNKRTDEVIDLPKTNRTLDADHSGL